MKTLCEQCVNECLMIPGCPNNKMKETLEQAMNNAGQIYSHPEREVFETGVYFGCNWQASQPSEQSADIKILTELLRKEEEKFADLRRDYELLKSENIELDATIENLADRCNKYEAALNKIIDINRQQALHQYGDPMRAESWVCVTVCRDALKED